MMTMMEVDDDNHDEMVMLMTSLDEDNEEQRRRHGQWAGLRVSRKLLLKTRSMSGPSSHSSPACLYS